MEIEQYDWEQLTDLIVEVVNSGSGREALLSAIKRLRLKYGPVALLLSTEADFIDDPEQRLGLYLQAIQQAEKSNDIACLMQSTESVIELYCDDFNDTDNAEKSLSELEKLVSLHGDQFLCKTAAEIRRSLIHLKH